MDSEHHPQSPLHFPSIEELDCLTQIERAGQWFPAGRLCPAPKFQKLRSVNPTSLETVIHSDVRSETTVVDVLGFVAVRVDVHDQRVAGHVVLGLGNQTEISIEKIPTE